MFWITPLSFDASSESSPSSLRKYPHKPYIAINDSHCATSLPPIVLVYLHSNFRGGLRKTHVFWNVVHNGLQGHRRSLILVPIESAYGTSYRSSIVTLVLSCPAVSEILQVSVQNSDPTPIPPEFWECSPYTRSPMLRLCRAKTLS